MSTELIILSCLIGILLIIIIWLAYALINEQIRSRRYLSNFLELWKEEYKKATLEIERERNNELRGNEI